LPKGAPLVAGWAHFAQNNKITDEILELNKDILDALLDVNQSGIWKKTQLASALEDLDGKVELGFDPDQGQGMGRPGSHVDHAALQVPEEQAEELPYWSQVSTVAE
jgi:hypothetical protein